MLVVKIRAAPISGPAASDHDALDADERCRPEPAAADEAAAAPERADAGAVLELDDGREQAPADGEPDRDRDQERASG